MLALLLALVAQIAAGPGCAAGRVQAGAAGLGVAGRHQAAGARDECGLPGVALGAHDRAQRVMAGLAGRGAVDHRGPAPHSG